MADALRATPHFLSELQQIARQPGSVQLLGAIEVALSHRQQLAANKVAAPDADPRLAASQMEARLPERQWTLTEALVLLQDPARKRELFGVLRLLQAAQPGQARLGYSRLAEEDPVRIEQSLMLHFAAGEVQDVLAPGEERRGAKQPDADADPTGTRRRQWGQRPVVRQAALGLLGPQGAMPYAWTEHTWDLAHSPYRSQRDWSFLAWINLIQRRQMALLYRAWADTQAHTAADRPGESHPLADRLEALAGLSHGELVQRDTVTPDFKRAFAAVLSRRVRGPHALEAMLTAHFQVPVRIEEFAARWLEIPADQRTGLAGGFAVLGDNAVAGARVWDCSTRFRIKVGPMPLPRYRQFLPHGPAYAELRDLVSLYVGPEWEWELVPVLQAQEVPYSWLGNQGLLLGWSSWLGVRYEDSDAGDLSLAMGARLA